MAAGLLAVEGAGSASIDGRRASILLVEEGEMSSSTLASSIKASSFKSPFWQLFLVGLWSGISLLGRSIWEEGWRRTDKVPGEAPVVSMFRQVRAL